jgi:hypothetical protein
MPTGKISSTPKASQRSCCRAATPSASCRSTSFHQGRRYAQPPANGCEPIWVRGHSSSKRPHQRQSLRSVSVAIVIDLVADFQNRRIIAKPTPPSQKRRSCQHRGLRSSPALIFAVSSRCRLWIASSRDCPTHRSSGAPTTLAENWPFVDSMKTETDIGPYGSVNHSTLSPRGQTVRTQIANTPTLHALLKHSCRARRASRTAS